MLLLRCVLSLRQFEHLLLRGITFLQVVPELLGILLGRQAGQDADIDVGLEQAETDDLLAVTSVSCSLDAIEEPVRREGGFDDAGPDLVVLPRELVDVDSDSGV